MNAFSPSTSARPERAAAARQPSARAVEPWQRRRLKALVALAAMVFSLATAIAGYRLVEERALLFSAYDRGVWAVVQAEREHQRLAAALDRHAALGTERTAEALRLRYDILWSRFPVLLTSRESAMLQRLDGFTASMRRNFAELQALEPAIAAIADGDLARVEAVRDRLDRMSVTMQHALQQVMTGESYMLQQDRIRGVHTQIVVSFGVLLLAGLLLFAGLFSQRSEARRLASAADRARGEAQRVEARLRDAIESTTEGFLIADAEDRIVIANQRFRDLYPWIADALVPGMPLGDLVRRSYESGHLVLPEPIPDAIGARLDRLRMPGEPFEQHFADGRTLLISERRTAEGGMVSVRTDVTGLKQAESLLRERLTAMDAAHDGIAITGPDGLFTYINPAYARMAGSDDPAAFLGRHWSSLYHPDEAAWLAAEVFPHFAESGAWRGSAVALTLDGRHVDQDMMLTALPDGGALSVVRDVSDRKRAEAERDALREQFFRAQKLEAVGRLAGGIAHDFNNILAAILGYAQLIEEDLPAGETRDFAGQVRIAGNRARALVGQILAFSRGGSGGVTDVPLAPLVRETAAMLRATVPATIDFSWQAPAPEVVVRADPTQLSQVLMNLAVNAVDAIGDGPGRVRVTCGPPPEEGADGGEEDGGAKGGADGGDAANDRPQAASGRPPGSRHHHTADGRTIEIAHTSAGATRLSVGRRTPGRRYYRFSVEDTGIGIAPDAAERIFDPFFTTKPVGRGSGLGLSAVLGIVTGHDGMIDVTTAAGGGSRFDIFIPLSTEAGPAETVAPAVTCIAPSSRPVMVVDDEAAVVDVTVRRLRRAGFAAEGTTDPAEAERRLTADPAGFPVLITDQQMPGMTGRCLASAARRAAPQLKVILCSGHIGPEGDPRGDPRDCPRGGPGEDSRDHPGYGPDDRPRHGPRDCPPAADPAVDRILVKPVDEADLLAAVAALLAAAEAGSTAGVG